MINKVHSNLRSLYPDLMSEPPQCSICLDEVTSPASLPCGHSFCLFCIGEYWRCSEPCQCPLCKAVFPTRPQLKTDPTPHASSEQATVPFKAGEVPCDICPVKHRAVRSCLQCMASYCATHLEPHYLNEELGCHHLIIVAKNLEDSVCRLHGKQLSSFCRSDRTVICALCAQTEHRGHHIISIHKEAEKKKVKLRKKKMKLQERLSKIEKIKLSWDLCTDSPEVAQSEEHVGKVEEEISDLQRRIAELEKLSQTEDNLHFLQRFPHAVSSS